MTHRRITCWQDLAEYGIEVLTGEACLIGAHYLCDLDERGARSSDPCSACPPTASWPRAGTPPAGSAPTSPRSSSPPTCSTSSRSSACSTAGAKHVIVTRRPRDLRGRRGAARRAGRRLGDGRGVPEAPRPGRDRPDLLAAGARGHRPRRHPRHERPDLINHHHRGTERWTKTNSCGCSTSTGPSPILPPADVAGGRPARGPHGRGRDAPRGHQLERPGGRRVGPAAGPRPAGGARLARSPRPRRARDGRLPRRRVRPRPAPDARLRRPAQAPVPHAAPGDARVPGAARVDGAQRGVRRPRRRPVRRAVRRAPRGGRDEGAGQAAGGTGRHDAEARPRRRRHGGGDGDRPRRRAWRWTGPPGTSRSWRTRRRRWAWARAAPAPTTAPGRGPVPPGPQERHAPADLSSWPAGTGASPSRSSAARSCTAWTTWSASRSTATIGRLAAGRAGPAGPARDRVGHAAADRRAAGHVPRATAPTEPVGKGPILVAVDESGSMAGEKVHTAKALALALAWIARQQRRWCGLVAYSGDTGERLLALPPGRWDEAALMDWLEQFIGRGLRPRRARPRVARVSTADLKAPAGDTDVIFITDASAASRPSVQGRSSPGSGGQGPAHHPGHPERARRPGRRSATRSTVPSLAVEEPPSGASCPSVDRDTAVHHHARCTTPRRSPSIATTDEESDRTKTNGLPFPVAAGTELLGEIITWNCAGVTRSATSTWSTPWRTSGLDERSPASWLPGTPSPGRAGSSPRSGSSAR